MKRVGAVTGGQSLAIGQTLEQWSSERPDLELSTLNFSISVLRLAKLIEDDFDRRCRSRFGLAASDVRVLLALRRSGEPYALRPTDIFRSLLISAGAVTKQVDRLAALKLVRRRKDPGHAGGSLVQLTAKGRQTANTVAEMVSSEGEIHEVLSSFGGAQRDAALSFLVSLLDRLESALAPRQPP